MAEAPGGEGGPTQDNFQRVTLWVSERSRKKTKAVEDSPLLFDFVIQILIHSVLQNRTIDHVATLCEEFKLKFLIMQENGIRQYVKRSPQMDLQLRGYPSRNLKRKLFV